MSRHDSLRRTVQFRDGISQDRSAPVTYHLADTRLLIETPCVNICQKEPSLSLCQSQWNKKKMISDILCDSINVEQLHESCLRLNLNRADVYSCRLDIIVKYLCVMRRSMEHFIGRDVVLSCQLGFHGISGNMVIQAVNNACYTLQKQFDFRMHHIFSVEIRLSKYNSIVINGSPQILEMYNTSCHPAVCICGGIPKSTLCHKWFIDTLLGGDMDMISGHQNAVFANGKIKQFRHLANTIFKLTDDIVFGGILAKSGVILLFQKDNGHAASLGFTSFEENTISITINTRFCVDPRILTETMLHEIAHARVALDISRYLGTEHHGPHWLQKMLDIRSLLACRLTDYSETVCTGTFWKKFL